MLDAIQPHPAQQLARTPGFIAPEESMTGLTFVSTPKL
jgi:hypothetical protein